jgi:hypothetical protein
LYNRDRREKLSEDFYFHILPTDMQDVSSQRQLLSSSCFISAYIEYCSMLTMLSLH